MTGGNDLGAPVWEFAKREGRLIARERAYKGKRFFDLRLWAAEGATPTSKGITMPREAVADLAEALAAYAADLNASR